MLAGFWSLIAGKLTDRWVAIVAPAVIFWVGGVTAWALPDPAHSRPAEIANQLAGDKVTDKILVLAAALLIVALSGLVVHRLSAPMLRLLEGYWPPRFHRLTSWRRRRELARKAADERAWQLIQSQLEKGELTHGQRTELAGLER